MRLAKTFRTSKNICLATTAAWDRFPTQQFSWLAREAAKRYADIEFSEEWLAFVPAPRTLSPEAESTPLMMAVVSCIVTCYAVACMHFCGAVMAFLFEPLSERSGAAKCVNNCDLQRHSGRARTFAWQRRPLGIVSRPNSSPGWPGRPPNVTLTSNFLRSGWHLCLLPAL